MMRDHEYSRFQPKSYNTRMPIFWWIRKWAHIKFITRELTSVPIALYAIVLLIHIRAVATGPEAYADFLAVLRTPISIALHAVTFLCVIFHSITWFNLAPKALVIRLRNKRLPAALISAINYVAWIIFSATIAWIFLKG
jgi:fumarate reductase subunit C